MQILLHLMFSYAWMPRRELLKKLFSTNVWVSLQSTTLISLNRNVCVSCWCGFDYLVMYAFGNFSQRITVVHIKSKTRSQRCLTCCLQSYRFRLQQTHARKKHIILRQLLPLKYNLDVYFSTSFYLITFGLSLIV